MADNLAHHSLPALDQGFCLEVGQSSLQVIQRRQDASFGYLDIGGSIQPSCQSSSGSGQGYARYFLSHGKLSSGALFYSTTRSTSRQVLNEPFAGLATHGDIDTVFSVVNGLLVWSNPAFDGGVARFCLPQSGPLRVIYSGPLPRGCPQVGIKIVAGTSPR